VPDPRLKVSQQDWRNNSICSSRFASALPRRMNGKPDSRFRAQITDLNKRLESNPAKAVADAGNNWTRK